MTYEALYYTFYYVIVCYTQATKQDTGFMLDQPKFEANITNLLYKFYYTNSLKRVSHIVKLYIMKIPY